MLVNDKGLLKKKIILYIFIITLFCFFYVLLNIDYILWRLNGDSLAHHKLSYKFFIGYNFKSFFSSYFLGFVNLFLIALSFWKIKKNIYENLFLLYLKIILIITYLFIIFVSLTFSGITGARYWAYLVPIIILINIFYLSNIKNKLLQNSIIITLILVTIFVSINDYKKPQIRKPDTPGLVKFINNSDTSNIVSQNISPFDHYLRNAYKKDLDKKIFYINEINQFNNDFLFICLDLLWIPNKSTYTKEIYDCYPKNISLKKFEKMETIKFYGYAISKFKYNKSNN